MFSMKFILSALIIVILVLLAHDLWNIYRKKLGYYRNVFLPAGPKIYYKFSGFYPYPHFIGSSFTRELQHADYLTFRTFDDVYARDNNSLYFFGKRVEGVDLQSFMIISYTFAKDKYNVYYKEFHVGSKEPLLCGKVEGADPETFEDYGYSYGKDKNGFYFSGKRIEGEPKIPKIDWDQDFPDNIRN